MSQINTVNALCTCIWMKVKTSGFFFFFLVHPTGSRSQCTVELSLENQMHPISICIYIHLGHIICSVLISIVFISEYKCFFFGICDLCIRFKMNHFCPTHKDQYNTCLEKKNSNHPVPFPKHKSAFFRRQIVKCKVF